jgi:hypothetical protein
MTWLHEHKSEISWTLFVISEFLPLITRYRGVMETLFVLVFQLIAFLINNLKRGKK